MRLYFDTETTGIPDKYLPLHHERQPYIVSIAWALMLDEPFLSHHAFIKPEGWAIDENGKAFAAHHIPQSKCEAEGLPIRDVLEEFKMALAQADEVVAYNIDFDIELVRIQCDRQHVTWPNFPRQTDVMPLATAYCQLPPTDRMKAKGFGNKFKPPKLSEALKIICNEDFPDAHDALADVRATIKIHRKLEEIADGSSPSTV